MDEDQKKELLLNMKIIIGCERRMKLYFVLLMKSHYLLNMKQTSGINLSIILGYRRLSVKSIITHGSLLWSQSRDSNRPQIQRSVC